MESQGGRTTEISIIEGTSAIELVTKVNAYLQGHLSHTAIHDIKRVGEGEVLIIHTVVEKEQTNGA